MALELMSPAGSFESITAAVRNGADAVYFGAGDFNARRNAKNLSGEELQEALRYCRLRGVRTYVTVNTLLTDRELDHAAELVALLSRSGASAVIVQDLGVLRMVKTVAPDLPVHASTQLTVHSLDGALECKELGFSRVVLSRELPRQEIELIARNAGIETEVFCHGALCMCYSGQCYLSAAIGGRSGNRGLCAQPCRLPYGFDGGRPHEYLSLKDLSLASHLQQLEQAGVTCVKIEGRMKRPEYTAIVTRIYKNAIREGRSPTAEELSSLQAVFSRSGFTQGYFEGKVDETMFGIRQESDARAAKPLYAEARHTFESEPEAPCVPVHFSFSAKKDHYLALQCRDDDGFSYETEADPAQAALHRATTAEEIRSALQKTGGTVFDPVSIEIELDEGLRIPVSTLNAMRRQCLDGVAAQRRLPPQRREAPWQAGYHRLNEKEKPQSIFSVLRFDQLSPELLRKKPAFVYLPLAEAADHAEECAVFQKAGIAVAAVLPRILWDEELPGAVEQLRRCKARGLDTAVCGNIGQLPLLRREGFHIRADFGMNIMNSQALKELKGMGAEAAAISFEMNLAQIRDVSKALPLELIAYGRLPLMIFENCAIRRGAAECACKKGPHSLTDKTGRAFPLMAEPHCRNTLYNSEILYLADKKQELEKTGCRWLRLNFTTEDRYDCVRIAEAYEAADTAREPITRGLYFRGVE